MREFSSSYSFLHYVFVYSRWSYFSKKWKTGTGDVSTYEQKSSINIITGRITFSYIKIHYTHMACPCFCLDSGSNLKRMFPLYQPANKMKLSKKQKNCFREQEQYENGGKNRSNGKFYCQIILPNNITMQSIHHRRLLCIISVPQTNTVVFQ